MIGRMGCPDAIKRLVERFDHQLDQLKHPDYNETKLRIDFVNPLFAELGWDIDNRRGYAEQYREVVHEDRLRVAGANKAPDYSFRVGGVRKFFLEAKKPAVDLKTAWEPAYQLRRYAWSAKLAVSLLTDFEELAVYDCRIRPKQLEKASVARREYIAYKQYEDKWDFLEGTFSREAVLRGDFDRYCGATRGRGAQEFDEAFLEEIEEWRKSLARNLASRNAALDERQVNFAVQRIIDRIIFLRICEDRGIEHVGQLRALINSDSIYPRLFKLFRDADTRYNSGLFHFKPEAGREEQPDELTPGLEVDDGTLKHIIKRLYYPESPYEFTVVSADILGSIYERFLGKVITLTASHRADIVEKPEVRKAGGVYYTPTYIVDYIVQHTVGKLLEGKTPKEAAALKTLDPACGSGSFLIGAYQYLLDWHLNWYAQNQPEKWTKGKEARLRPARPNEPPPSLFPPVAPPKASESWRLTIQERKRILLNNIHGVDIDYQAVEVTKLSLLLKVLEGETADSLSGYWALYRERALPDLGRNIQCGNSLIGTDIMSTEAWQKMSEDERRRVNPFDFERAFPEVFKQGGFDAVIGNPPYIGFHGFAEQKQFLRERFQSAQGKFDIYLPFIEKGLRLTRTDGLLGYICPTNFMKRAHGQALRSHLRTTAAIQEIVDFQDVQIFDGALNYTGLLFLQNCAPAQDHGFLYRQRRLDDSGRITRQAALKDEPWVFRDAHADRLVGAILRAPVTRLGEMATGISEGIVTGCNDVFLLERQDARALELEAEVLRPYVRGKEIRRYHLEPTEYYVIYPYREVESRTVPLAWDELKRLPGVRKYLESQRPNLLGRGYFEASSKQWHELWCQRDLRLLSAKKILVPELAEGNRFVLAGPESFYGDTVCGIVLKSDVREDIRYVLALLNSRLAELYYKRTTVPKANGFYIYKTMFLKEVPIRRIDFTNEADQEIHDRLVSLADSLLSLHRDVEAAKLPHDKDRLQTTDRRGGLADRPSCVWALRADGRRGGLDREQRRHPRRRLTREA